MDKCIDQILTLQKRPKQRTAEPKFKGEMRGQHSKRKGMDGMETREEALEKGTAGLPHQAGNCPEGEMGQGGESIRAQMHPCVFFLKIASLGVILRGHGWKDPGDLAKAH